MKKIMLSMLSLWACAAGAQSNLPPTFIKGTLGISYNSRVQAGAKDTYQLDVNVCNSARFHGVITDRAKVETTWYGGKSDTGGRVVEYSIDCDIYNPKDINQTRNVGKIFGTVPISVDGVYHYDNGTLVTDILPLGNQGGINSKFTGAIAGKPMNRPANWLDNFSGQAVTVFRSVGGTTTRLVLKKYDKMFYNNTVLGGGPVGRYQPVSVSGEMLYDYDKACWFLNGMGCTCGGKFDRIAGTIRWVESPQRKVNGQGEYQFDVRLNEPPPNESAAFSNAASDESAFFQTDTSIPALTGTMKYVDKLRGDTTLASMVSIDLNGNNLSKEQCMELFKIIILSAVVPMNAD